MREIVGADAEEIHLGAKLIEDERRRWHLNHQAERHLVALRHSGPEAEEEPVFVLGRWRVDLAKRQVLVEGREVHLTPLEYSLFTTLIHHAGKVVTHRQLLKEVWGGAAGAQPLYLRVYMTQLRHKLEEEPSRPKYLQTEPGVGYRLWVDD